MILNSIEKNDDLKQIDRTESIINKFWIVAN